MILQPTQQIALLDYDETFFREFLHLCTMSSYTAHTASVNTTFNKNGTSSKVTTIYRNHKVSHYYHGMAPDDQITLSEKDFAALFDVNGALRPVSFQHLSSDCRTLLQNNERTPSEKINYKVLSNDCLEIKIHENTAETIIKIHILS